MKILSHRGYWKVPSEKNSPIAFSRSFQLNFGTETDLRDLSGSLVVSHDPPLGDILRADSFFRLYKGFPGDLPLALNVKADGLQKMLRAELERHQIDNYFVFDMSVPDALLYAHGGFKMFTRQSELEIEPALYNEAVGVWIDCFFSDWVDEATIEGHLNRGKGVCLVSPDLHKREHRVFWEWLAARQVAQSTELMICTDHPEEAREFFS